MTVQTNGPSLNLALLQIEQSFTDLNLCRPPAVPGNERSRSDNVATDFPVQATIPAGTSQSLPSQSLPPIRLVLTLPAIPSARLALSRLDCTGGADGQTCLVRAKNGARAGPFVRSLCPLLSHSLLGRLSLTLRFSFLGWMLRRNSGTNCRCHRQATDDEASRRPH